MQGDVLQPPPPVHPHVCGEHLYKWSTSRINAGSSPRMWGTLRPGHRTCKAFRFIPTYVGNTAGIPTTRHRRPVHPHVCGEHSGDVITKHYEGGSSPRMWGTPVRQAYKPNQSRFIPTYVGNTSHDDFECKGVTVHPHVCGEHMVWFLSIKTISGSSPRMWGTHAAVDAEIRIRRFIPTYVGNTRRTSL